MENTKPETTTPPPGSGVKALQEQLIAVLLKIILVVGLLAAIGGTVETISSGTDQYWPLFLYWGAYATVIILIFWKKAPYLLKTWAIIGLLFLVGIANFLDEGLNGRSQAIFVSIAVLGGLLLGRYPGRWIIAGNFTTMIVFATLYSTNSLAAPYATRSDVLGEWIVAIAVVLALSIMLNGSLDFLIPQLSLALKQSQALAQELAAQQINLEKQITERTAELQKRNQQLAYVSEIAREFSTIQDLDILLSESAKRIANDFDFDHVGIFLNDESDSLAILRAASSEGGQRMLARNHSLRIGEIGIVGYVTDRGMPRISLDVGTDAVFFNNPDLPNTRSEMALPLRVRGQILGALDIQSSQPNAFNSEDITIMQTLADQLALAINTARLLEEVQANLEETQRVYGEISQAAWQKYLRGQTDLAEKYDPGGIIPANKTWSDEMKAAHTQKTVMINNAGKHPSLAIPIVERGRVIGVVNAYKPENTPGWSNEDVSLMEVIIEQLGTALDSARSYQDTRLAAIREQKTSDATARVRATLDIETIIRTATEEIREALNLPEVTIQIGQPDLPKTGNGS